MLKKRRMKKKSVKSKLWSAKRGGVKGCGMKLRRAERGGVKECGMTLRIAERVGVKECRMKHSRANPGRGAPMGFRSAYYSGGAPKKGG